MKKNILLATTFSLFFSLSSYASNAPITVSGYSTVGYIQTASGEYNEVDKNNGVDKKGSFDDQTEMGIGFETDNKKTLSVFSSFNFSNREDGSDRLYSSIESLALTFNLDNMFKVDIGRMLVPMYLDNDSTSLEPTSVYDQLPFDSYNGMAVTSASYPIYGAQIVTKAFVGQNNFDYKGNKINAKWLAGFNSVIYSYDWELNLSYVKSVFTDTTLTSNSNSSRNINENEPAYNFSLGASYDAGRTFFNAEYASRGIADATSYPTLMGFYVTSGYHLDNFSPYTIIQLQATDPKDKEAGMSSDFSSIGLGFEYLVDNLSFKSEISNFMFDKDSTYGYATLLNGFDASQKSVTVFTANFTIEF